MKIPIDQITLFGELVIPSYASALVLFAHGSGSSRLSPRNQYVAKYLQKSGIGTLLFDLLTQEEESIDDATRELRFDIPLLAKRLMKATQWAQNQSALPIGYFGASTGAAAALIAAAKIQNIKAVVSRGGRPDLASDALSKVTAPTLLIVGGADIDVIELNKTAFQKLRCPKELKIIQGATHLFEESGALEQVAKLATDWFLKYEIS